MSLTASCHCGQVVLEADGAPTRLTECNCSFCARTGALLWFVPGTAVRLRTPLGSVATYTFNTGKILHRFCPNCGVNVYGEGTDPTGNAVAAINARCIEGLDLAALPHDAFDGRSR